MGKSRAPEHQAFFDWLLKQITSQQVDALIVAGDVFDTGTPPSYAREMFNRFVVDLHDIGCQFIVLAGNHDSVATLNESKSLLACLNTQLVACVNKPDENQQDSVIPLYKRDGEVGAILCAVPFIRPRDVLCSQAGQSADDKKKSMQYAIADYYQALYQQAVDYQTSHKTALPIIGTGHMTTVGATSSDSVREIYIGTLDAFPASAFPAMDYIALGHIHQSQKVAKSEHIRYSGSPIPLSFDESKQSKSVLLVDFAKGKFKQAKALEIPCFQQMRVIKGDLKSIETQLAELSESLSDQQTIWLEIKVSSQDYLNDLQVRIEKMIEGQPIEVLRLHRERKTAQITLQQQEKETLNELGVMDVFERRLNEESWQGNADKKTLKRIRKQFKSVLNELENTTNTDDGAA
jgi:exonuclease SbcD